MQPPNYFHATESISSLADLYSSSRLAMVALLSINAGSSSNIALSLSFCTYTFKISFSVTYFPIITLTVRCRLQINVLWIVALPFSCLANNAYKYNHLNLISWNHIVLVIKGRAVLQCIVKNKIGQILRSWSKSVCQSTFFFFYFHEDTSPISL